MDFVEGLKKDKSENDILPDYCRAPYCSLTGRKAPYFSATVAGIMPAPSTLRQSLRGKTMPQLFETSFPIILWIRTSSPFAELFFSYSSQYSASAILVSSDVAHHLGKDK